MTDEKSRIENRRSKILYLDPFSGIAGDMLLGALLDLGLDLARLQQELDKLKLAGCRIGARRVARGAISAIKFDLEGRHEHEKEHEHGHEHEHPHRHEHRSWADIKALIESSDLGGPVKSRSIRVFAKLAEAEGKIHGRAPEEVLFHEVGALDSIVDIVGACAALELLGIDEIRCGPVALGSGTVRCAHGLLPVPAPATAELMQGLPVRASPIEAELTTPTGAALVAALATSFGPMPDMTIAKVAYGAGTREQPALPNVLRVFLGTLAAPGVETDSPATSDSVLEIRTNLDDVSAEVLGYLAEKLLALGTLDVFFTPIQMKKGRPATLLTVLAEPHQLEAVAATLFTECGTFGLRYQTQSRFKLARRHVTVRTAFGDVRVKLGEWQGQVVGVHPEFEDCRARAEEKGVPLRAVMEAARAACEQERGG
ncbi:MAG: nickel pincer cofactor biosynthesis protein LarC [Planctomycetota bacterium]